MSHSFEIKSAQLPLVALLLHTSDLASVMVDIVTQFGPGSASPDFFEQDPLVIDFSQLSQQEISQNLSELVTTLHACHLKPIAFRNATANQAALASACGLLEVEPERLRSKPGHDRRTDAPAPAPATVTVTVLPLTHEVIREVIKEVVHEVPGPATIVLDKPLRSGQKFYARGADLVVLAMVNMGAEVVADGNIHVYAPLRGKAMAGASGNTQARIFSLCLEPELISIAGVYRTSEHPLPLDIQGKAAQVRLSDDGQEKLLFEALPS